MSSALSALSYPGIPEARKLGCPCPPVNRSGWNHEYGTPPTAAIDVDAWCPVHGLEAIQRDIDARNYTEDEVRAAMKEAA